MNHILFENYKKLLLIVLLSVILAACVLPSIHFLTEYLNENNAAYLVMFCIDLILIIFILRYLIIVISNFNKIFYFKIFDGKFEYLSIPNQTHSSRGAGFERLKAIYFKPDYKTKSFYNIDQFKAKNSSQIEMIFSDGADITLPLYLSQKKLGESILKLNTKLEDFKKLN